MVGAAAGLRSLAVPLMKIANDIRWLASGPRCGLSELILPANEPGSSIMPGKVNPTQCEAMVMVCIQVLAGDSAIAFAGSQGNFELNAMRPVIISNFLHSAVILADACGKLRQYCIEGTQLHRDQVDAYVSRSLMLVTACPRSSATTRPPPSRTRPTTRAPPCARPPWPPATSAPPTSTGSSTPPPWRPRSGHPHSTSDKQRLVPKRGSRPGTRLRQSWQAHADPT